MVFRFQKLKISELLDSWIIYVGGTWNLFDFGILWFGEFKLNGFGISGFAEFIISEFCDFTTSGFRDTYIYIYIYIYINSCIMYIYVYIYIHIRNWAVVFSFNFLLVADGVMHFRGLVWYAKMSVRWTRRRQASMVLLRLCRNTLICKLTFWWPEIKIIIKKTQSPAPDSHEIAFLLERLTVWRIFVGLKITIF